MDTLDNGYIEILVFLVFSLCLVRPMAVKYKCKDERKTETNTRKGPTMNATMTMTANLTEMTAETTVTMNAARQVGSLNYSAIIGEISGDLILARQLGHECSLITWADGTTEVVDGSPMDVAIWVAEAIEAEGVSTRFTVKLANGREVGDAIIALREREELRD